METLEFTVSSLDEAIKLACDKWGVGAGEVSAEVVEEQPGLFGKKKLRVAVTKSEGKAVKAKPAKAPKAEKKPTKAAPEVVAEEPEAPAKPRGRKKVVAEAVPAENGVAEGEAEREDVVASQEDADRLADVLREILSLADLEVDVEVRDFNGRYVNLVLDGKDTAHVVGKSGEVLNNLQYLVNVISSRQIGNGVRVTLDGNQYRERREAKLKELAMHVAQQVIERQEEAVFDALPAFERRVVHKVLSEMDGVTTYSEGEEPFRHVVIAPAG